MSTPAYDGNLAPVYRLDDYRTVEAPEAPLDTEKVWEEVMAAAQLFGTLRESGMSVRFDTDGDGPPRVCITDLEGKEIKQISRSAACDPTTLAREAFSG